MKLNIVKDKLFTPILFVVGMSMLATLYIREQWSKFTKNIKWN